MADFVDNFVDTLAESSFSRVKGMSAESFTKTKEVINPEQTFSETTQRCYKCKKTKLTSEFFKGKKWCKLCWYASRNEAYHNNPDNARKVNNNANARAYRANNYLHYRETHNKYCREWYRRKKEAKQASIPEEQLILLRQEKEAKRLQRLARIKKYKSEWQRNKAIEKRRGDPEALEQHLLRVSKYPATNAKVSEEQVRQIRFKYAQGGVTMQSIASEYSLSTHAVRSIIRGETWKHVA